jgi:prevent-host-death family protein
MKVTAYELKTRCGEMIERAAAGEEITITKRGVAKVKMVPLNHFDPKKQARVLANMTKIRKRLARKGVKITRDDIKDAIEDGRL